MFYTSGTLFRKGRRVELFRLYKISNIHGYIKREILKEGFGDVVFKGIDSVYTPFVYRKYLGEQVQESDKIFLPFRNCVPVKNRLFKILGRCRL